MSRWIPGTKIHVEGPSVGRLITFEDASLRRVSGVVVARYNERNQKSKTGKKLIVNVGGRERLVPLDHVVLVHTVRPRLPSAPVTHQTARPKPSKLKPAKKAPRRPAPPFDELAGRPMYFAYGSNMDEAQMHARVPGVVRVGSAWLHGYEFLFSGYSTTWGGAVANVRKKPRSKVFGVLYSLPPRGLSTLSRFEGPRYHLRHVHVRLIPTGATVSCSLYLQRQTTAEAPPAPAYTALILKALRCHGAP